MEHLHIKKRNSNIRIIASVSILAFAACKTEPPPDMVDPGQLLYFGYKKKSVNCARCHGPEGQGGTPAPAIQKVFTKYSEDEIVDIIATGKGEDKDAMPPLETELTEAEMSQIIRYLRTLQTE